VVVAFDKQPTGGLLTISQAATLAGVHRSTVRAWCEAGRLPSVRVNRRGERRIRRDDLTRLVKARSHKSIARSADPVVSLEANSGEPLSSAPIRLIREQIDRAETLRRMTAEISGASTLETLFEDVLDSSLSLFGCQRAALWLYDAGKARPLTLAAQRHLPDDLAQSVAELTTDSPAAGLRAIQTGTVVVLGNPREQTNKRIREMYRRASISTVCFVPVIFREEPLGLLVLYHSLPFDWSANERQLARSFADGMAAAIGSARLYDSVQAQAARLHAIQELAVRLNRIQDVSEIGQAIVGETRRLLDYDTIRVYRVDEATAMCEPIAFHGRFLGTGDPPADRLRVAVGTGLTGWVAEHNETLRIADATADKRGLIVGDAGMPESMLLVPMSFEDRVCGVIVVSKLGQDRFDTDDEATLSIFAGYAAQALINAENLAELQRQRAELEHQLVSQRQLLEVNERLLSTLDPQGVLEMIADSLKTVVQYDSLTIYRVDRERGVRRPILARDRFADVIMDYEGPLGIGITGWVIAHREAVRSNDAHLDSRSVQIPGTPFEPESMVVVPLLVDREVIGTLNVGRMGESESHFSVNEFELVKLFAGQASIALQNAEAHGAVKVRADHDSLTGLRNHGAFQRELGELLAQAGEEPFSVLMMDLDSFKAFNDSCGHPAGDSLLSAVAGAVHGAVRDKDRVYRYGGDEFAVLLPGASRGQAFEVGQRIRRAVAELPDPPTGPKVTISVGVSCYPDDGVLKDALVCAADEALYMVKPSSRPHNENLAASDSYLSALDETALALMERPDPTSLLETIMVRAANLLGTPHGYIYLIDDDAKTLVVRVGIGQFEDYIGYRMPIDTGVAGTVFRTAKPFAVDDYDAFSGRAADMPRDAFGAVVGVPLTSGANVVGVIGLASGDPARTFGDREIAALGRFAQLASIALDNARLADTAKRVALYDPITGLPNRELLVDRMGHSLSWTRSGDNDPIALILLDLDRFKVVNESVGHAIGDRLLVEVARRLSGCVRPGDTVARFGGDEFAIVVDGMVGPDDARRAAERISSELKAPFRLAGREWFISASMGIAVGNPGEATPDDILREAEVALYRSKRDPSLRYALFEPSMSDATLERVDLENDLRQALDRDELRLHYQPIVDLATDRVVGLEALVRWDHPRRGLVQPLSFIPLAEETGLILPIGEWVLAMACRQAHEWRTRYPDNPLLMSVNLSARQFSQPDLVDTITRILAETKLPAEALELEITESVLMDESETGIRTLRRLRDLGARLVLDDFGTGYSSLSYLKHLPLDTIKIDRSFVTGLGERDQANLPIVEAVISLAHGLGIEVVAEGIETVGEASKLRELGCDRGQGYVYSRPIPAQQISRLMAEARRTQRREGSAGAATRPSKPKRSRGPATRREVAASPTTPRARSGHAGGQPAHH
jgi:diguanylate cyclase (GGDEF)-like protein/excisionase family DNA binding protein